MNSKISEQYIAEVEENKKLRDEKYASLLNELYTLVDLLNLGKNDFTKKYEITTISIPETSLPPHVKQYIKAKEYMANEAKHKE